MKDFSQCMTAPSLFYSLLKPYARAVFLMGRIVEGDKGNATGENTKATESFSGDVLCEVILLPLGESAVLKLNVLFALMHQMFV